MQTLAQTKELNEDLQAQMQEKDSLINNLVDKIGFLKQKLIEIKNNYDQYVLENQNKEEKQKSAINEISERDKKIEK